MRKSDKGTDIHKLVANAMEAISSMEECDDFWNCVLNVQAGNHSILCFHTSTQEWMPIYLLWYSEMTFTFFNFKLSFIA